MVDQQLLRTVIPHAGADDIIIYLCLVGRIGSFRHPPGSVGGYRLCNPGVIFLQADFAALKGSERFVQQLQESGIVAEGAVQQRQAVGGRIVLIVVVFQILPGHLRNVIRIAAVVVGDGGAGECRLVGSVQRRFAQVHGAEHFGIYGAVQRQVGIGIRHFIAPGLGTVDALIGHDPRIQAQVRVEIRQFQQLLLGKGSNGEAGHGICRIGVDVGVVCLVCDVEPQVSGRIFVRSAEGAVLKDMGQAHIIFHPGDECELEGTVRIAVGDIEQLRTGLRVLKKNQLRADQAEFTDFLYLKALHHVADGRERGGGGSFAKGRDNAQQHGQGK